MNPTQAGYRHVQTIQEYKATIAGRQVPRSIEFHLFQRIHPPSRNAMASVPEAIQVPPCENPAENPLASAFLAGSESAQR